MPLTDAEKKRRSRARKSSAYHDRERELSRKRMALGRARNRAQKRAMQLRSLLNQEDREAFVARAAEEKERLICDWFRRQKLRFDPKVINNDKILNVFISKLDLCRIDLQVAEFEISLMGVGGDNSQEKNIASGPGGNNDSTMGVRDHNTEGKNPAFGREGEKNVAFQPVKGNEEAAAESREILSSRHSPERNINTEIDRLVKKGEILGVKQEEVAQPGYSGANDQRESQRWDDEVLAAEAMAMMQTSQGGKTNSLSS